jgi:hypothetical protein
MSVRYTIAASLAGVLIFEAGRPGTGAAQASQ